MDQQNARAYALLSPALISLALFLVAPIIFVIIYSFWLRTAMVPPWWRTTAWA